MRDYTLVYAIDPFSNSTYLLNNEGKIIQLVYNLRYNICETEITNEYKDIVRKLRSRVHSFLKFIESY